MDQLAEASGWIASACVLAAFLMKRMRPLRLAAIASNVAFVAYAAQLGLLPILLLHAALLPINLWRLSEQHRAEAVPKTSSRAGWAVVTVLLALLLVLGPAAADELPEGPAVEIRFMEAGGLGGRLFLPARRPVAGLVLLLPDGLGADPRSASYVEQLLGADLVVFDVLRGEEDPAAVARAVAALPAAAGLEAKPVGVIGFGAGARRALGLGPGVAGRVLLYPGCAGLAAAAAAATDPVLVLHGKADAGNSAEDCADLAERLASGGRPVRRIAYAGAGYAWDYPAFGQSQRSLLPRPDGGGLVAALAWPELTAMSAAQAAGFLGGALRAATW
ncbi:dienelactone hydrolase family protein [Belnapia sp. T18]|uniref:Dienelactone hydrolase family protein n=1 Tax=Belnapia arida TaxID=2804533 RepID=A0ABS1UBE2_9PROT|nr:dienelactone hydrolase family protein [Belnapia arida]MBL6081974.1 dienelactone hydrolase family protein [Belnapia arida]